MTSKHMPRPYAPSILVVDDSPEIRTLFRRILQDAGYLVSEAGSGREAIRLVRDRFFDVLIVDLSMPEMDGFEVLRAIRSELPNIKVLVVSGFMADSLLPMARRLGATAALEKATAPARLLPAVCSLIAAA